MTYQRRLQTCVRCDHAVIVGWQWPDGFVCVSCVRHGVRHRADCPGCGAHRPLPGRDGDNRPSCVDCAGISTSFFCTTCGAEGELWFAHTCLRCSLRRRLTAVLDNGRGTVTTTLVPLLEAMASMSDPWSGLTWLGTAHVRERLAALATGAVALTHEDIDIQMPAGQGREHLRELLVAHSLLPARDKYLAAYQRWEAGRLDTIEHHDHRQQIRAYLRWRHHPELAARAEVAPLSASTVATARARTNAGLRLLLWLRARNTALADCDQAAVDAWFATASNPGEARDFLGWAIRHRRCPPLSIPSRKRGSPTVGAQDKRARTLHRLLTDDHLEPGDRVAGCLVLLLAQPVTRVCKLRLADIHHHDGEVRLQLGDHPVALPRPVAALVVALIGDRPNMATAANLASPWLFPGQAPGQHLHPTQLSHRLRRLGIRATGRQAAMQQLVADVPAPLLAEAIGYHPQTTARRAAEQGTDWAAYAALKARQTAST